MMKRFLAIAAVLSVSFMIIGCTGITTTVPAVTTTTTAITTSSPTGTTTPPTTDTTTSSTPVTTTTTATPSYTVAFSVDGGTEVPDQTILKDGVVASVVSTREDYELAGWYLDEALTDEWDFAAAVVTGDLTLYAKWIFTYAPEGLGTADDPYLVATVKDLEILLDGRFETQTDDCFRLAADLLAIETDFAAIDGVAFRGVFDGNGFTIEITGDAGLFYQNEGTIRNLTVIGDIETETVSSIGIVAHHNLGVIENVVVEGEGVRSLVGEVGVLNLDGIGGAGAIVGTNEADGVIDGCETHTNVQARFGGGGIAGVNKGTIQNCSSWGTVGEKEVVYISADEASVGKFSYAGGIAGINLGTIVASQNRGRVFAQRAGNSIDDPTNGNRVFGGIAGYNGPEGIVTECYNAYGTAGATVHADRIVGGIVGHNFGTVTYSYSPANIGGRANIGGIVGLQDESETSVEYVAYCWTNSNFRSDGNEADEIGAYDVAAVSNWYNLAKFADYSAYHGTRGLAPAGEGNQAVASVTLDMTTLLNTGLSAGEEKWMVTEGSSSGNAKTKLAWQQVRTTFMVGGVPTVVVAPMGNAPAFADPVMEGYAFREWRTDENDPNTVWARTGLTSDSTLYAVFAPVEYAISYQLDGGTNDAANPTSYTIESAPVALAPATRAGAEFIGWFDADDAAVATIPTGSSGDLTLYAKWTIVVPFVTVAFADTDLPAQTLLELEGANLTLAVLEKAGFRFQGWSLDGTTVAFGGGTTVVYADVSAAALEGVVTLVPIFTEIFTYTVSFAANGGVGAMDPLTYVVGDAYVLPANAFTAEGYTFYGWSFGTTVYQDAASVTDLVASGLNAELVALWRADANIVTNGDFAIGGVMTTADDKTFTSDVWSVYRSGTVNIPSLAGEIADGVMTIDATIGTGAKNTNFYVVVQIDVPDIAVGSTYILSFDASVSDATYDWIGAYIRSRASGSTTYVTVSNLAAFTTLDTASATFTAVLTASAAIAEGNTYYLIIPLASTAGGVAGTFTWTIDNVVLSEFGAAN